MTTTLLPTAISELLETIEENTNWAETVQDSPLFHRELTELLCYTDTADFIVIDGKDIWLFVSNEWELTWRVEFLGTSLDYYWHEELIGESISEDEKESIHAELQHDLKPLNVVYGQHSKSLLEKCFSDKLDKIFWDCVQRVI